MRICVVGLGNIGFNLFAYLLPKFPGEVTGVDIDERRIEQLRKEGYAVTSNYDELGKIDIWLLAPSTGNQGQNLFAALKQMKIRPGALVSIESTLPIGSMGRVREYLQARGFTLGSDLYLIHVPHRVMFGVDQTVCDTPRVIGAYTEACLQKGREFYSGLVPELIEVPDIRVVELCKVIENVKRHIDVAFAQEIYRYCVEKGLDFSSLRKAVNSKANVELLGTDWGIGGECLPKDIGFLRSVFESPLLEGAETADREYREQLVAQVGTEQKVWVRGISYKTGVKDLKHSRGVELVRALERNGNTVWVEDPLFSPEELAEAGFTPYLKNNGDSSEQRNLGQIPDLILERERALEPQIVKRGADING